MQDDATLDLLYYFQGFLGVRRECPDSRMTVFVCIHHWMAFFGVSAKHAFSYVYVYVWINMRGGPWYHHDCLDDSAMLFVSLMWRDDIYPWIMYITS